MMIFIGFVLVSSLALASGLYPSSHTLFPKGFQFGTATASYQVEGAWNEDGKGLQTWDVFVHNDPTKISNNATGDVACDSYHKYKEDVQHVKNLGFTFYRFSISWARVLPKGTLDVVNPLGVQYYHNLIDELLDNGIEPMVTLFHWDLPYEFEKVGGWMNGDVVRHFENYADFVFNEYGSKVKWFITINEPLSVVDGYGGTSLAPQYDLHGYGEYMSGHNMIRAHAKAYRLYQKKYKHYGAKITFASCQTFCLPKNETDPEDIEAADRCFQFNVGWFAHPVFVGDYPEVMKELIAENSRNEGLTQSRLPSFTKEEIKEIKGSADFFAMNHYTSRLATPGKEGIDPSHSRDSNTVTSVDPSWKRGGADWLYVVPQGMRAVMKKLKTEYNSPEIVITENGFGSFESVHVNDCDRIDYYESYMAELRDAIYKDSVNVTGLVFWSVLDNFEWMDGYSKRFGLIDVDFSSPDRPRTWKKSAYWVQHYLALHSIMYSD